MLIALTLAVSSAAAAMAAPPRRPDQSTMPPSNAPVGVVGDDDAGVPWATAQTFVAGQSGYLDVVELSLAATGGRFRLTVQGVTPAGTPDGAPLAMAFVDGCRVPGDASAVTEVWFSPAAQITAATPYALVLEPHQGNLPGTAATWRLGKGKAVPGSTYRGRSGGEVTAWERVKDATPQAYSTYVSTQAPDEFTRSATTLTVTAKPDALKRYRTTTLTAHVAVRDDSAKVPSGTVTFRVKGEAGDPVTVPVNGDGDAATSMSWQTAGTRHVTASFCPADPAWISSDGTVDVTVTDEKTATTVALQTIPAGVVAWELVTLRATVTPAEAGLPGLTGTVQFSNDHGPIGEPLKLDGTGTASIPFAAGAGDLKLRARYSGDGLYAASEATSAQSVKQARTVTSIGSSANPAQAGKAIRWAVDVAAQPPSQGAPTGRVRLTIDGNKPTEYTLKQLRQGPLTVTDLAVGRHAVVVDYTGDADYRASTARLMQTVTAPADSPAPPTNSSPTVTPAAPASGQPAAPAPPSALPVPRAPTTPVAPGGTPATPVVRPMDGAALVRALHVARTLRARAGRVVVGTAANPPVRSLSAALFADRGTQAASARKATVLGRVRLVIAGGQRRTIGVVLNRAGRRALRAHGRLRVELRITAVDTSGRTVRTTLVRVLRNAHH